MILTHTPVIEKKNPPIYTIPAPTPDSRPLQSFTAFPPNRITILGPRRVPAIKTPLGNGNKHVTFYTSTGFRNVPATEYPSRVAALRPDIAIPLADLPHTSSTPPAKKLVRMVDRTDEWFEELLRNRRGDERSGDVAIFAPVLPVERPLQWQYLDRLSDGVEGLSGLAVYDVDIIPELGEYPALTPLPRLVLQSPRTPHDLLRQIALGADMTLVPFINDASDAGIALSFTFPAPESTVQLPLGLDTWAPENKTDTTPLVEGCGCYACRAHHRAYVHHLLSANEMLSWTLLQVHNHHVVSRFFEGVREVLARGGEEFARAVDAFKMAYEPEMPEGTGQRPRVRGYHFKSQGGEEKSNERPWTKLEGEATGTKATSGLGAEGTG